MNTPAAVSQSGARPFVLIALFALQAFCVLTLIGDAAAELAGFDADAPSLTAEPLDREDWLEFAIVAALSCSLAFTGYEMRRMLTRQKRLEEQVSAASGAFQDVLHAHFERWALTEAERDVALLAIKGLTIAEIAAMRQSREGTVKAQCSAIYRKAGVTGRPQLISLFIEELMAEPIMAAGAG
ncbi:MAG: helix-turn-helix transcriptional regulator [Pseudomonadota bacterium]